MSPLDTGFGLQTLGRIRGFQTEEQPKAMHPPMGQPGAAHLDTTLDYPPKYTTSPERTVRSDALARSGRYDFLDPPQADDELGRLAHYRVQRLIGEGGMGLVFLAEDTRLVRPVALKVIKPEQAASPGVSKRFLREARATAAIKHDHIVTIYHVGREREVLLPGYGVPQGVSLARWVQPGRKPTTSQVLRVGREIGGRTGRCAPSRPGSPRHQARQHLAGGAFRPGQDP